MLNLPAIRARYEAATLGPWRAGYKDGSAPDTVMTVAEQRRQTKVGIRGESGTTKKGRYVTLTRDDTLPPLTFPPMSDVLCEMESEDLSDAERLANAEFIAHARSDIPLLVEALEEAQGKLNAVQSAYDNFECRRWDAMMTVKELDRILSKEKSE